MNTKMNTNGSMTVKVLGTDYKVFNAAPQRRNAVAYDLGTGAAYPISCGRIDLTDTDDVEARILEAVTWNAGLLDGNN